MLCFILHCVIFLNMIRSNIPFIITMLDFDSLWFLLSPTLTQLSPPFFIYPVNNLVHRSSVLYNLPVCWVCCHVIWFCSWGCWNLLFSPYEKMGNWPHDGPWVYANGNPPLGTLPTNLICMSEAPHNISDSTLAFLSSFSKTLTINFTICQYYPVCYLVWLLPYVVLKSIWRNPFIF